MNFQSVFFLGIGGIGMSAIARFLKQKNLSVAGYDKTPTPLTQQLQQEGIPVYYEDEPALLQGFECVVYTPAIPKNLQLFQKAQQSVPKLFKRAEILGEISKNYRTLAVAGTHGKTTTSGMLTHLLKSSHIDCTAFIGGISSNYQSNFIPGTENLLVVEADEYDRSFLTLHPDYAIITSVDPDHLDIYLTNEGFQLGFQQFAQQVQKKIYLYEDLKEFSLHLKAPYRFYGLSEGTEYQIQLRHSEGLVQYFDYQSPTIRIEDLELSIPGEHNLKNLCAAISLALEVGATPEGIRQGTKTFQGIQRRFDLKIQTNELVYLDDYAHHPQEIASLLQAVKKLLPKHHMLAIFQPHLFSRTRDFYKAFAESLSIADTVVLLPIYPARENPIPGVSTDLIFQYLTVPNKYLSTLSQAPDLIISLIHKPTVVLTIGAGDIDTLVEPLKQKLLTIV